jgi:Flavin containing amine oxidoreductase.
MPGNPLGLQRDDLVFEQAAGARTAALLANMSGTSLHLVEVAGSFGRALAAQGEAAMIDFAGDWLATLFGSDVKRAIKRGYATRWNDEPFVLGAMSAAAPGSADARKVLMEPLGGRIWFAGEAVHETQWGTVGGAWESGTRAAEAALRRIGALKEPDEDRPARRSRERPRRRRGEDD